MDIILLSEEKLKITLTKDDLDLYSLTFDSIDYDNTETKLALWSILNKAKHSTGFDAAKERMFIQVYKRKDGGCNLFVTKLPEKLPDVDNNTDFPDYEHIRKSEHTRLIPEASSQYNLSEQAKTHKKSDENRQDGISSQTEITDGTHTDTHTELIFSFSNICDLLTVCRKLSDMKFTEKSSVYADRNSNMFFLALTGSPNTLKNLRFAFVEEFGKSESLDISYISMQCDSICSDNAVEIMSELSATSSGVRIEV